MFLVRNSIKAGLFFLMVFVFLGLVACQLTPQEGTPAINQMDTDLANGIAQNQQLAQHNSNSLPDDVNQALLPNMTIDDTNNAPSEARFNISVKNVQAKDFFMGLVKDTPYNIIVDPKVDGIISLTLKNVTVPEVLQAMHDLYGYNFTKTAYGYQVTPAGLETRVFSVDYLDVVRSGQSNTSISSGGITQEMTNNSTSTASGTSSSGTTQQSVTASSDVKTETKNDFWKELNDTLVALIGKEDGRKVIMNPTSGTVIITAYPNEITQVGDYLDSLQNIMDRQVMIDAKILEVNLYKAYQAGVNWSRLGFNQNFSGDPNAGNAISTGNSDIDNNLGPFTSVFTITANGRDFSGVINLLSAQGNVQVLSSPRIATLNNQKAVIKVGQDEFFITNVSSTDTTPSAGGAQTTQNINLTPFFSGIALDVTPEISGDENVILHIHPIVSKVIDQTKTFKITGTETSLPLALSTTRESDNIVYAHNNQMVVIGGLMGDATSEVTAQTPFLGRIPLLGALFRRTNQQSTKSEIIILLRPTVVTNQSIAERLKADREHFQTLNRGFHFGDYPETFGNTGDLGKPRKNKA